MSFVSTLEHDLASVFAHRADAANALFTEILPIVNLAGPVVAAVERELKPVLPAGADERAVKIEAFLAGYTPKSANLTAQAQTLAQEPAALLLRNAAKFAVQTLVPNPILDSLLNLVIETAYQLYVVQPETVPAKSNA